MDIYRDAMYLQVQLQAHDYKSVCMTKHVDVWTYVCIHTCTVYMSATYVRACLYMYIGSFGYIHMDRGLYIFVYVAHAYIYTSICVHMHKDHSVQRCIPL